MDSAAFKDDAIARAAQGISNKGFFTPPKFACSSSLVGKLLQVCDRGERIFTSIALMSTLRARSEIGGLVVGTENLVSSLNQQLGAKAAIREINGEI